MEVIERRGLNITGSCKLDVSLLKSGTYIIKVYSSGGNRIGKLVIQ
jgi:hypothetical protein